MMRVHGGVNGGTGRDTSCDGSRAPAAMANALICWMILPPAVPTVTDVTVPAHYRRSGAFLSLSSLSSPYALYGGKCHKCHSRHRLPATPQKSANLTSRRRMTVLAEAIASEAAA